MKYPEMLAVLLLPVLLISCHTEKNHKADEQVILDLLKTERKAHVERNPDLFISVFSDSMISVNRGQVLKAGKEERRTKIASYFDRSEFVKWDDTQPPIIRFSSDGSLAYAVVQKEVILAGRESADETKNDTTHYAWVSIYRKGPQGWKIEANISTNRE